VLVLADGRVRGLNTDGLGFLRNLREQAPNWSGSDGPALLLGTGGAARAVATALIEAGVPSLRLANRNRERAQALAADLAPIGGDVEVVSWAEREAALEGAALLVNCTSLGMTGEPPLEIRLDPLPNQAVVSDLVYVPLETPLLAAARRRGNPVVEGLGMLLHQAVPGFAHWGGTPPTVDADLRSHVLGTSTPG
jgi:shikimate dehydrogenase